MRKILCMIIFSCFLYTNVHAGEYEGLLPGQSTKTQADDLLGKPLSEVIPHSRYNYDGSNHDAKKISVTFQKKSQIIESINIYPQHNYVRKHFAEWFELKQPTRTQFDREDNFIEFYDDQGLALYFDGPDNKSIIKYFSHYNYQISQSTNFNNSTDMVSADNTALSAEDLYKQANEFIQQEQYKEAIPLYKKAHLLEKENTLYSSRLGFAYFKNDNINEAMKAFKHSLSIKEDYQASRFLGIIYFHKHQYKNATPHLKQALSFNSTKNQDPDLIEYLGTCYYETGRLRESFNTFVTSRKMDKKRPISAYYLGLISDRLGNRAEAKFFYKKYLKLKHNNEEMNQLAKERLKEVSKRSKSSSRTNKSWGDVFKTVSDELKDF